LWRRKIGSESLKMEAGKSRPDASVSARRLEIRGVPPKAMAADLNGDSELPAGGGPWTATAVRRTVFAPALSENVRSDYGNRSNHEWTDITSR
jgi:hypothetical protein